jgi:hypothetical protein
LNCLNIQAMEVLGGRHEDSSGAPTPANPGHIVGIDYALTGEGYEEMDPLIPAATQGKGGRGGYNPDMSDLQMASSVGEGGFGPHESSIFSEVTHSVILPPR